MRIRILAAAVFVLFVFPLGKGLIRATESSAEPNEFVHEYIGLSDDQIEQIHRGKAVAKILESRTPDEVFVSGSVYIKASSEDYLKFALDLDALRKLPNYLAIRKFSDPPKLSDLDGFVLNEEDIKQLKGCKLGQCEIQLPAETMEAFQKSVNWSAPDVTDQVNHIAQKMALEALQQYIHGGNTALGTYRDKKHPAEVAETFQSLLSRSKALPVYLPDLNHYLLDYPNVSPDNVETQFYWEKVNFGLKPTLRIVQTIVYRGKSESEPAYVVTEKQLYASHYFETALDLSGKDSEHPARPGFYLITLKGSQQAGLTGFKGGIVRKVAVDKTRSSLERALATIKQMLETPSN